MRSRFDEVSGIDWGGGAVMNAVWTGPLLRDVLLKAGVGVDSGAGYEGIHVQFECNASKVQEDDWYGGSIPLGVAMDEKREVLLALKVRCFSSSCFQLMLPALVILPRNRAKRKHAASQMNNSPLPPRHGYPVRTITPGIIGARSVKWLDSIVLSSRESQNFYQQHDYKILPASATSPEEAEALGLWDAGRMPPMMDVAVNSVVAVPSADDTELPRDPQTGTVRIKGYAIPSGANGPVVSVHVSLDRGQTWHEARILDGGDENTTSPENRGVAQRGKFSWVLWEAGVGVDGDAPKEDVCVWSKAVDYGGNTQEDLEGSWNLRGVGFNAVEGRKGIKIV